VCALLLGFLNKEASGSLPKTCQVKEARALRICGQKIKALIVKGEVALKVLKKEVS